MGSIVVTGASGGFGPALLKELAQGGKPVVAVVRSQKRAPDVPGVRFVELDALSSAAFRDLLRGLEGEGLAPEGAVLAAGNWQGGKKLHEQGPDDPTWRAMLENNLETAHAALSALLPGLVERQRGSVVLVGSRAAVRPGESAGAAAYAAAKAGLLALAQVAAAEVLQSGVRVNVVMPSTIDTAPNRAAMPSADFSRWVAPESLAQVIAFLLSDAARDVTGAAIPVYGRVGS